MAENEIKNTKEWFEDFIETYALSNQETIEFQKAVSCLEELQQYRAIGTVEECRTAYARGYNQGTIDRAEEVTKAREQGYAKAIDEFAERLKQRVSRHYVDCDGYFGGIAEEILYADYIDEIAEEMRGAE